MSGNDPEKARQISEMLLDVTGTAMLSKDFETLARCFRVPHVIETPDKKTILKTTKALRAIFDRVTEDYESKRITELVRICEVAEFRGPHRIEATHITHMMSGSLRVQDPFPAFSVLEFIDGRWQITSSQYAVDNKTAVGRALHLTLPDEDNN